MKMSEPKQSKLLEKFILYFIFFLGLAFTFLIPPFQKADESVHFLRAVTVSKGDIFCAEEEGERFFSIEAKYYEYIRDLAYRIAGEYKEKFFFSDLVDVELGNYDSQEMIQWKTFCNLPALAYIPSALMIRIGGIFNSLTLLFYLARLINFIIFFLVLCFSYNKVKDSELRWIVLSYALIPMVIHQASAVGYDALQLTLAPLIFVLLVSFIKDKKIKGEDLLIYFISVILLLLAKPGYYFFALLYFLIPSSKLAKDKKGYLLYTSLYILACVLTVVLYLKLFATANTLPPVGVDPRAQLKGLLDLSSLMNVVRNTIDDRLYFYVQSFFGLFGWLDYEMSPLWSWLFTLCCAFLSFKIRKNEFFSKLYGKTFLLGGMLFLTVGFLFGSVYLTWNEVGNRIISGVQGRYFLVLYPFFILFLAGFFRILEENRKVRYLFTLMVILFMLLEIGYVVYMRYYDYSYIPKGNSYSVMIERKSLNKYEDFEIRLKKVSV